MKISVAMATYNGAKYLQEQLDSLLTQTRQPDEVIINDDCSTDDTLEIIQSFAERAPFPVVWERNKRNLGLVENFNRALMRTSGDLVFLSDQDDVWFSDKIARVVQVASCCSALVIMNDAALTDADLNEVGLTKLGQIRSGGLPDKAFVMGCCIAIKRDLLDLCLPITQGYPAHDTWIVEFADGMGRKRIIPDVLQWYRRHDSNASQGISSNTLKLRRLDILLSKLTSSLRDIFIKERKTDLNNSQHLNLLLQGVHSAERRANSIYGKELQVIAVALEQNNVALSKRSKIRTNPRYQRLGLIVGLWRQGGYAKFSGLKSALKDLVVR